MDYQENCPISTTPYAQSADVVNPNIINLNYTNQDFWSMKSRLIKFIQERFGPAGTVLPNTYNDFVESDIAIMLIENWAFLADTLSFKTDQIANEIFIDTVSELENAFRLAKLVGFYPQPPIAAKSLWSGTINNRLSVDIEISTPIPIDMAVDGSPLTIELFSCDSNFNPIFNQSIVIPSGSLETKNIVGLEGRTYDDTFTSTGNVSMSFQISRSSVIYDSIQVAVDGVLWRQVDYFTDSNPRREYRVEFDSSWNAYIMFGNNRSGLIPSGGSMINVTYRIGGGTVGNIVTNYSTAQWQASAPGIEYNIPVSFTNYTQGKYGYNGDTLEDVKYKLPKYLRTQDRAVSGSDYKTFADQFVTPYNGQIGKSTAVLRNYGCAGNIIDLYVLAVLNTLYLEKASPELKAEFATALNDKKMMTDFVCLRDGVVIEVDVAIEATLDKSYRKFEEEIKLSIESRAEHFFSLNNWDYKQILKDVDLTRALSDVKQVDSYDINFTNLSDESNGGTYVDARYYEIIRPNNIVITMFYT